VAAPLEFLFQLDAKIDGQLKMLAAIDDSIKKLHDLDKATSKTTSETEKAEKASGRAAAAHKKHAEGALNIGKAYEHSKEKVHDFLEAMGLIVAFEAVEKLVEKVRELGSEILNAAGGAERTAKSFELLLGGEGAEETLGWIEGIAKHTEFTDDRIKGIGASFVQVGLRGKQFKREVAAALDIAALPGGNLEAAADAIARLQRTGHVDNKALAPLGLGEKDFFAQLSKRTGSPIDVLKQQIEKGKPDVVQALEALNDLITARTGKALGGGGVHMSKTLGARLTHLKDLPDQFFQSLAKTESFQKFSDQVGKLLDELDPDSPKGKKIFGGLEKAFAGFVSMMTEANIKKFADTLVELFTDLPPLINAVVKALEGVAWLGKLVGETAAKVYLRGPVTATEAGEDDPRRIARRLRNQREEPSPYKTEGVVHDVVAEARAERLARKLGQSSAKGMAAGMVEAKPHVAAAGEDLAATAHGATKKGLDIHSPSKVFQQLGRMSGEGFAQGLDDSMGRAMTDSVPVGAFARPASAGGSVSVQITVNVEAAAGHDAGAAEQMGQDVAARVEAILPGALQAAFEKMQIEAGA
jgi:hypothetical protein